MDISREQVITRVAEKANYWKKDVKNVFNTLEDVLLEYLGEMAEDEPISIRIFQGLVLQGNMIPERERVDPRNREPIICPPTVRVSVKCSSLFKKKIQEQCEEKAE